MDECLWVLKESRKNRSDGYSVRNRVFIISHITFQDCPFLIFSDNLSRNSCMWYELVGKDTRSQFFKMWMMLVLFTKYISYSVSGTLMVYQVLIYCIVIYWVENYGNSIFKKFGPDLRDHALIPFVLSFHKICLCFSFLSWWTYIVPVVQKENTVVVHAHVYATLYPTQCFQLKRIAVFNCVSTQIYIPVHLITNPTKAACMLIPANFFWVKGMRFSFPKMSQWLPKIYDDFPKTSKHCWKYPKMFWWPLSIPKAI